MAKANKAAETHEEPELETQAEESASERPKMDLSVEIKKAGPCKKHVHVRVPRAEIDRFYEDTVKAEASVAVVPGFRPGHVPAKLVEKRLKILSGILLPGQSGVHQK